MTQYYIQYNTHQLLINILKNYNKVFLITDTNVNNLYKNQIRSLNTDHIYIIPAGEPSKSFDLVKEIIDNMFSININRDSCIIAVFCKR